MSVRFVCPRCRTKLKVDDDLAGQVAACPGCGRKLDVPQATAQVKSATKRRPKTAVPEDSHHSDDDEPPLVKMSPSIDHEDLIDMTAMVDIVFFLLIFFLVTSMQSLDSASPLPTTSILVDCFAPKRSSRSLATKSGTSCTATPSTWIASFLSMRTMT